MKILTSRQVKTSKWKFLREAAGTLSIEVRAAEEPTVGSRAEAARDLEEVLQRAREEIAGKSARMACFTDLPVQALPEHATRFGRFGLALKKDSPPAAKCHPVQYMLPNSRLLQLAVLGEQFRETLRIIHKQRLSISNVLAKGPVQKALRWIGALDAIENDDRAQEMLIEELEKAQKTLEMLQLAYTEDVRHIDQHEWRYVDVANEPLTFAPEDVAFLVVDTTERAQWWNKALHGADTDMDTREALAPFGQHGVYAVALDAIAGRS